MARSGYSPLDSRLVEATPDAFVAVDGTQTVVEFNPAAERLFGYARDNAVGRSLPELLVPARLRARQQYRFASAAAGGEAPLLGKRVRLPALRADGSEVAVDCVVTRLSDSPVVFGAFLRAVAVAGGPAEPPGNGLIALNETAGKTELQAAEGELQAVHAVSQTLAEWESFEEGMTELLARIGAALGWAAGALWVPAEAGNDKLLCRAFWSELGLDAADFERATRRLELAPTSAGLPGRAWSERKPVGVADASSDPDFRRRTEAARAELKGGVAFPIAAEGTAYGCLEFFGRESRELTERMARTLTTIGEQVARFLARRRPQGKPAPLTARERQVLQLAAGGLTTAAIARELVISQSTVKTHFEKIFGRLEVSDRSAAVAEGFRRGLIE